MSESCLKEAKTFFTEGNKKSDAVIQVEDHELHVDLLVISLMSPTLASEFQPRPDPLSPPSETNKAVAKLDGRVDHIVDILTSIYPNFRSVNVVDEDNVEYLLPLAAKYKLLFLMETCKTLIIGAVPRMNASSKTCQIEITNEDYNEEKKDRLMRYFVLAHKHELDVLRKCCMDKLVKCSYSIQTYNMILGNSKPTRCTAAFQQLDPTTRWEILRNRLFYLEVRRVCRLWRKEDRLRVFVAVLVGLCSMKWDHGTCVFKTGLPWFYKLTLLSSNSGAGSDTWAGVTDIQDVRFGC